MVHSYVISCCQPRVLTASIILSAHPFAQDLALPSLMSLLISTYLLTMGMNDDDEEFKRDMALNQKASQSVELAPRGKLVFATGKNAFPSSS